MKSKTRKPLSQFAIGDRVIYDATGLHFRMVVVAADRNTWTLRLTQRPDASGQIRAVNADQVYASAARYQDVIKHPPNVGWSYHWSKAPTNLETVEFKTGRGETRYADLEIKVSRRADRKHLSLEPTMTLAEARTTLTSEGATAFDDHGLVHIAFRPSKSREGEQATAVIRWVGNDAGATAEERADAWEIQGGWTS